MKKTVLTTIIFVAAAVTSVHAQLFPSAPVTRSLALQSDSACGSGNLYAFYSWPSANCLPGYFLTSQSTNTTFYLERSTNGVSGWTVVASGGPQLNNTARTFPITQGGYYRCMANMTFTGSGGGGGCWNGSTSFNYMYTNIVHVALSPVTATFNINGNAASYPTVIPVWLCNSPFILNNSSTPGSVQKYSWSVVRTNSSGVPLASPNNYSYTFPYTNGNPSSINLVTGTSSNILVPGYYIVTLKVKNTLCGESTKNAFLQVKATPSAATLNFQVLQNGGSSVPPSTNPALPILCGATSVALQGITPVTTGWGAGDLSMRIRLEEVNASGVPLGTQPSQFSNMTLMSVNYSNYQPLSAFTAYYNLNGLTTGYFSTQGYAYVLNGRKFKISFDIQSPCGVVTYYSFISFTGNPWEIVAPNPRDEAVRTGISVVSVYPNPVTDQLNVVLSEAPSSAVAYQLLDMKGNVAASGRLTAGARLQIPMDGLAPGIYAYVLDVNGIQQRGKVTKQ